MNKAELIDVLTEKLGTDRRTATAAVEEIVDTIVRAVNKGQSVTITGFGVFEQRKRAARVARNPRTGETVKVKPTSVPAFRPGAQFKAIIAGKQKIAASGPAVKRGVAAPVSGAAAKKAAAKKASKAPAKKAATKAPATRTAAKKTAAKKTVAKKAATKVTAAKKATKVTAAKKTVAKKAPAKKTAAKKTAAKRTR
ncbi:HU family DNA-binding protein [Nocardia stercoris]|uniref:DNA-binding protein HupB n=1 Tax=Nocardia stercoris TaxID=2483361 RepID=A0A3M2LL04_9NOCA|nr:HU family DNA-binding protein [Nocardia stercoris]RMI35508.1 HU family DNA-binding protein [Nocardia stercoris]